MIVVMAVVVLEVVVMGVIVVECMGNKGVDMEVS